MTVTRFLLLPGWQNAGPGHWQTRWELLQGFERLHQDDWWWPRRGDWMARLDETLHDDPRPAVLVAHGLGCHLVAAWAAHAQQVGRVAAALLVAPPDLERSDAAPQLQRWAPISRQTLPMPSTAVLSSDDPRSAVTRSRQAAHHWGCEIVNLGAAGQVNADSGLGDWPEGLGLLRALLRRAGLPTDLPGDRGAG